MHIQNYFVYLLGNHKTIHKMNEKNQARLRHMAMVLKSLDLSVNDFYAIGVQAGVTLQGRYTYHIASKFAKFPHEISEGGYARFKVGKHITVTLT